VGVSGQRLHVGIGVDQNLPWATLVERWRLIEALGFDSIWVFDHLNQPSRPAGPYFEAWTTLAGLAVHTERVRIGVLVSCNTFRHPSVLAKQAITLDHMSRGRVDVGLGAGWFVPEHEAFGIEFPAPGERVSRFREAVEVVDRLLSQERATYAGRFYHLRDAVCLPRPVQQPRPPLMLAGHGPRMLRIIAELGEGWNSFGTPAEIRERNALLDAACREIGRDPATLTRSLYGWATQTPSESWADERAGGWAQGLARGDRRLPADPWASAQACLDFVESYREAGIDHFVIDAPRAEQIPAMERFAADLLPRLRASLA
jgi:F420-dependent oxidoreductase-like protein